MRGSLVCLCLLLLGRVALADAETAAAKHHFEVGTRAFNLGEFKSAAAEYRAAYKLKPDPGLLYNIAQAYRLDKDIEQALFFYRSYLRNAVDSRARQEVEGRIAVLEEQQKQEQLPPNGVKPIPEPVTKPIAPVPPTPEAPTVEVAATAPAAVAQPVYKKWWLWTTVVVVAGVGLGVGLGLGLQPSVPGSPLGNHKVF